MKFEYAMECLRQGQAIWRQLDPEKGYLKGNVDQEGNIGPIYGSFYMTIYDVLANDWTNDEYPKDEVQDA
jgi:hypothetical protein